MAAKKTNKTEHVMNLLTGQTALHTAEQGTGTGTASSRLEQTIASQTVAHQTIINQTIREQTVAAAKPAQPEPIQPGQIPPDATPPGQIPPDTIPSGPIPPDTPGADILHSDIPHSAILQSDMPAAGSALPKPAEPSLSGQPQTEPFPAEPNQTKPSKADARMDTPRRTAPPSGVKFVDSSKNEDSPISNAIKESLEREAAQMGLLPAKALQPDPESGQDALPPDATAAQAPPQEAAADTARAQAPSQETAADTAKAQASSQEAAADTAKAQAPTGEAPADRTAPQAPLQEASADTANAQEPHEAPYLYVNVMEDGVKDRCLEFMEKLDICTCDRCQKDVTALALSNLPAKYIVADRAAIAPLMNYYKNKYSSHIMAELTKACFAIHKQPRH